MAIHCSLSASRPWPFEERAKPAISFGVQERSNFSYMNGGTDGEGGSFYGMAPVEPELAEIERKPLESGNNVATVLVDSGASSHYFDDTIIPDLEHRLQDYTSRSTPRTISTSGAALLDGTAEGVLQGIITDYEEHHLARITILIVPGIGRNLLSVKQQRERASFRFSISTNPGWELGTLPCHFTERTTVSTPSSYASVRMDTQGRSWR